MFCTTHHTTRLKVADARQPAFPAAVATAAQWKIYTAQVTTIRLEAKLAFPA